MKRKFKRRNKPYDAYHTVQARQSVTNRSPESTFDWEMDEFYLNKREGRLGSSGWYKVGHVKRRRPR